MFWWLLFFILIIPIWYGYKYLLTKKTWREAKSSRDVFFNQYKTQLQKISLGCSFTPAEWSAEEQLEGVPLKALKYLVEELLMKDIRLGIRWSDVVDESNRVVNTDSFKSYLDYCLNNNVNVCLNIGPIKSFRWPEEHLPEKFRIKNLKFKKVKLDSEIAKEAIEYLYNLIEFLKANYSEKELDLIKIIQPENEGFNRMGELKLKISHDYLEKVIEIINRQFPNKKILVNSAGRFNLREIVNFYKKLTHKDLKLKNKLVVGYDYYYKTEFRNKFFLSRVIDSIDFSLPYDLSINRLKKLSKKYCFDTEITELQFELWGKCTDPGNYLKDLQFAILRALTVLDLNNSNKSIIRLWGVEIFVKKVLNNQLTNEHREMIELIKSINSC